MNKIIKYAAVGLCSIILGLGSIEPASASNILSIEDITLQDNIAQEATEKKKEKKKIKETTVKNSEQETEEVAIIEETQTESEIEEVPISNDIVEYAKQYVGNAYVYGGNSLTGGIDCSHFVWQVLKNTGHYDGNYATSAGWKNLGQSVSSLDEAQAGDIIVYSGHVAIYDGQGKLIQAKGSKYGITYDRDADYKKILAIRRFN